MAAKKSSSKQATITIDHETLEKLSNALHVLADVGNAVDMGASDAATRARLGKSAKKSAKKRR